MMNQRIRKKLKNGETTFGLWVTLESPSITEIAVELDLDWICIDLEHGYLSYQQVAGHLQAANGSNLSVFVRVPTHALESVKRVLDLGAHGIVLPLVRSAEDITTIQQYAYYPPKGQRGLGGERNVKWGLGLREYTSNANDDIMIIPVIETKDAAEAIDDILALEGIETILFGPGDLSSSYGYLGQWEGPGMAELILEMKEKASKLGIGSAVMARNTEDAKLRSDQGFAMVGLGSDAGIVVRHVGKLLADLGVKEIDHRWF